MPSSARKKKICGSRNEDLRGGIEQAGVRHVDSQRHFFFNDTPTTEIYTLSLHDAVPIWREAEADRPRHDALQSPCGSPGPVPRQPADRKSTRLNSSHEWISYAVFCLKKKKRFTVSTLIILYKKEQEVIPS